MSPERPALATDVHVIAAGAFEHVLHDLIEPFRDEAGHVLRLSITNAGGVVRKLAADEPAGVVMTSAGGHDARAAPEEKADPASRVGVGRMRLGAAVAPLAGDLDLATADAVRAALLAAPAVA